MLFVRSATQFAETNGFRKWDAAAAAGLKPGSRWYAINRDRTIVLFVVGSEPVENGMRIVNTHIDSPRIEFKTRPFRESQQAVLIDTQVHGGIKNYQWANVPLAITGRVDKADGTTAWIDIGNAPGDPVLLITDLAPHVDRDFRGRLQPEVIRTEELDPLIGTMPPDAAAGQRTATDRVLAMLHQKYGITARDFLSADLQIVPATMPRDVGLDRALIGAYGQDDRVTGYVSLRAIADVKTPRYTSVAYAVNNEEVNSWNTGVNSEWFNTLVSEMLMAQQGKDFNALSLRRTYSRTNVLVSDATTAMDPLFPQPQNPNLTSRLGLRAGGQGVRCRPRSQLGVLREDARSLRSRQSQMADARATTPATAGRRLRPGLRGRTWKSWTSASGSSACTRRSRCRRRSISGTCGEASWRSSGANAGYGPRVTGLRLRATGYGSKSTPGESFHSGSSARLTARICSIPSAPYSSRSSCCFSALRPTPCSASGAPPIAITPRAISRIASRPRRTSSKLCGTTFG